MAKDEVQVIDVPAVDQMDELNVDNWYRDGNAEVEPIDAAEIQRDIILRILSGTTAEEIMAPVTTTPAENVLGRSLYIRGYKRLPSTKADSALRFYLLIDAVDNQGNVLNITCGSANVIARLAGMRAHNFLPMYAAIVQQATPTASGYYPMDLQGRSQDAFTKEPAPTPTDAPF